MKAPLFVAALLLATPVAVHASTVGSDDPNMAGTTNRMFIINATTPGGLTFSGAGTATFNNAVGTSNQFNVGSNTSLGVNASISATQEFDGASVGIMTMGTGSSLMQTNGTSSSAAATQAASSAANSVATETAKRESHAQGWEKATTATGLTSVETGSYGSYDRNGEWQFTTSYDSAWGSMDETARGASGFSTEAAYETERTKFKQFKNSYTTEYNSNYNSSYSSAYNNVITNSASTATESSATGIIKGDFLSTEDSMTAIGQEGQLAAITRSALDAANKADPTSTSSATWKAAFNAAYEAGYQQAVGSTSTVSDSQVSIEGLGAIASVNADEKSNFTVNLDRLEAFKATGSQTNSSATANGSSTATLSTNSFATQNNQRTASAFMQAFAAQ